MWGYGGEFFVVVYSHVYVGFWVLVMPFSELLNSEVGLGTVEAGNLVRNSLPNLYQAFNPGSMQ